MVWHRRFLGLVLFSVLVAACGGSPAAPSRLLFTKSGVGDSVFSMPADVARVHVVATYTDYASNFIVTIDGRLILNELLGTGFNSTRYDGTVLTGGGGTVAITSSSGVSWSFTEVR